MKNVLLAALLVASVLFGVSAATAQPPTPATWIERVDCDRGCLSPSVAYVAVELEGQMCAVANGGDISVACKNKGEDSCTWTTACRSKKRVAQDLTITWECACLEKKTGGGGDPDRLVKTGK